MSKWSKKLGYDSDEEVYFSWWILELIEFGYIKEYKRQYPTFKLFTKVEYEIIKALKTKQKIVKRELLKPATYTCDYYIEWNRKAHGLFIKTLPTIEGKKPILFCQGQYESFIDVKPAFERHQSRQAKFSLLQKVVWDKHKVYVQPVVYQTLFKQTFTPGRFLICNQTSKDRKINFETKTLTEFIKGG